MPVPWLLLHPASFSAHLKQGNTAPMVDTLGGVTIIHRNASYIRSTGTYEMTQGVVVKYDVTTIHADHLLIERNESHAKATGHVHVDDPTGTIDADNIELWWGKDKQHSLIRNAILKVGTARISAEEVDITPQRWLISKARGTTSRAKPSWYEVRSPRVILYPGKNGKIKRPTLYLLGSRIVTMPDRSFNLDPRSEGLGIPSLTYRPGQGFGPSWAGGILVNHSTDFAFGFGAFPGARPSYGVSLTHSLMPDEKAQSLITPSSELSERFTEGYLESIHVTSPSQEDGNIRNLKRAIAFDSNWNLGAIGRGGGSAYSKAGEGVYEVGGGLGKFGYIGQIRAQTIRENGDPFKTRAIIVGALSLPGVQLGPNLRTMGRIDTNLFAGPRQYGWLRAIVGLAFEPIKQFRLSAGAYASTETGDPDFIIDRLVSKQGASIRADINLGPTKLSYMSKYDTHLRWFDHEYSVSQVVGCFEPFILYRQYPGEYALGLRLNLSDLTDLIGRRNFVRPSSERTVISPKPDGNP